MRVDGSGGGSKDCCTFVTYVLADVEADAGISEGGVG